MDWLDYREKLGIDFHDEEKGEFCSSLILNLLSDLLEERHNLKHMDFLNFDDISNKEYSFFCKMTGTQYKDDFNFYIYKIIECLKEHKTPFKSFLTYYVALINCIENRPDGIKKNELMDILNESFSRSKLKFALLVDDGSYFIFPKGAKELDDALVSEPLSWLIQYPETRKAWISALKGYSEATELTASETADKFRKALERFFQEFFGSDKSLENLKSEYGSFLSRKGIPAEIRNNFEKLLESYTKYNNNYAKHHDRTSLNVLEYIMYQTGNLMRLMITLNQEEDVNAD